MSHGLSYTVAGVDVFFAPASWPWLDVSEPLMVTAPRP